MVIVVNKGIIARTEKIRIQKITAEIAPRLIPPELAITIKTITPIAAMIPTVTL